MASPYPTVSDYLAKIPLLREQLKGLPTSLPFASKLIDPKDPANLRDVYGVFSSFQPDQDWLEKTEDLPGAVGKVFKQVFGWNADRDKAEVFSTRGKDVEEIADVLEVYLKCDECQGNYGLLGEWVNHMHSMAEKTHEVHESPVEDDGEWPDLEFS